MNATQLAWLVAATAAGCAASIEPQAGPDAPPASGRVVLTRGPDGVVTARVDATDVAAWTYLDLDLATAGEADRDGGWDLAARRFDLMLDGGASGPGGVEVVPRPGPWATVSTVPAAGWLTDAVDADGAPDYAFARGDGWYAYDVATHVLTPRPLVWVVRTDADAVVKLVIETYYDEAGTAGVFTLRWAALEGAP